jgi:hypothetical protein
MERTELALRNPRHVTSFVEKNEQEVDSVWHSKDRHFSSCPQGVRVTYYKECLESSVLCEPNHGISVGSSCLLRGVSD